MNYPDEFDALHKSLINDAKQHPAYANDTETALYGYSEGAEHALEIVRRQGYSKPRIVTTVEELARLGRNAAILAINGAVLVNDGEDDIPWASFAEDALGGPVWIDPIDVKLPATVLHEGDPS